MKRINATKFHRKGERNLHLRLSVTMSEKRQLAA
jgi:hypothetical protein